MGSSRRTRDDPTLVALLDEAGRNVEQATVLLRDLLTDWPERAEIAGQLFVCEQEGDRITRDVIHRLAQVDDGPMDATDGLRLATAVNDVVDFAEQAADQLGLYGVEAAMEQAVALAHVLADAGAEVASALRAVDDGGEHLQVHIREIHRLENEGDRVSRDGVASLFANGIDPMVVIRWKDILDTLEASIDACETVGNVLEGIALKRR